jgi:hypothetical protein
MPRNRLVIDQRPTNSSVKDPKPTLDSVTDPKPSMTFNTSSNDVLYTQVLTKGMYMGIPPFTYSEAGTVQSPFNP